MVTRRYLRLLVGAVAVAAVTSAQSRPEQESWRRVLRMTDAEQETFVRSYMDAGMMGSGWDGLGMLVLNRSSLAVPVIEEKIEEVLRSKNPIECFTNKAVNPNHFVDVAAIMIADRGDEPALKEISKLLAIDEKRFDGLVRSVLSSAIANHRNAFELAYKGLELGNPAVDARIVAWAEKNLGEVVYDTPGSPRVQWAEAVVERYGGVPIEPEWTNDPIVSRMKPETAQSFRKPMFRQLAIAWEKAPRRLLAMSDADQIAFAKSQLDRGIPEEHRDAFEVLARAHSSLILPMIEAKMEEVVKSPNPIDCFLDKSVNPYGVLVLGAMILTHAADVEALRQAGKLMKVKKVTDLVPSILNTAAGRGNPCTVLYGGLEIGDPEVEKQIVAWAEERLAEPSLNIPRDPRRQCAAAMVKRYGGSPTAEQWAKDPLVSRLRPSLAESFRADATRFTTEAEGKRTEK